MGAVYSTLGKSEVGKQTGKTILNTRIILAFILKKFGVWVWIGFVGFRPGKGGA
jgi:hypothetical protein